MSRRTLLAAFLLALVAGSASWSGSRLVARALSAPPAHPYGLDGVWFGAQVDSLVRRLTEDDWNQDVTVGHPLLSLIGRAPARIALRLLPHANPLDVVRAGVALSAGVWAGLLFLVLHLVTRRLVDAALLTLLGMASAGAMFEFSVPETSSIGAAMILPAFAVVAIARRRRLPGWLSAVTGAASAFITSIGGVYGIAAAGVLHGRRAIQIVANAVCLILLLWGLQRFIYPPSEVKGASGHAPVSRAADRPSTAAVAAGFFVDGMVMPRVASGPAGTSDVPTLHADWPGSQGPVGNLALAAWILLLVIGALSCRSGAVPMELKVFTIAALCGQLVLHVALRQATAGNSLECLPLLLVLAALGTQTGRRPLVLGLAGVALSTAITSNVMQFGRSLDLARQLTAAVIR